MNIKFLSVVTPPPDIYQLMNYTPHQSTFNDSYRQNRYEPPSYQYNDHSKYPTGYCGNMPNGFLSIYSQYAPKYLSLLTNCHITVTRHINSAPYASDYKRGTNNKTLQMQIKY